jgi:hypothetical protein
VALCLERHERKGGVLRGEFCAVVKFRLGPQREAIGELVRRYLHRLRCEAVHRVRLVTGAGHQRRESQVHALRALALQDKGIERIEGLIRLIVGSCRRNRRKHPAFRRRQIDVVEVMEIRRIFQVAEHRQSVRLRSRIDRQRRPEPRSTDSTEPETQHMPAGELRPAHKIPQDRLPILAALSESYHHSDGRPDRPYFGIGSAWLKRSHRA